MSENTITVDTTVDNPTEVVEVPGTTKTPAQSVAESLKYSFTKDILVKPLAAVKVKKSFETQQPTGEKDENGFESRIKVVGNPVFMAYCHSRTDQKSTCNIYSRYKKFI